jgi:hypothetical protein
MSEFLASDEDRVSLHPIITKLGRYLLKANMHLEKWDEEERSSEKKNSLLKNIRTKSSKSKRMSFCSPFTYSKFNISTECCILQTTVSSSDRIKNFNASKSRSSKITSNQSTFGSDSYLYTIKCFPTFIIAGTQKSGTTVLSTLLSENENISFAPAKEIHFFDKDSNYKQGREKYLNSFRSWNFTDETHRSNPLFYGEATPFYIASRSSSSSS